MRIHPKLAVGIFALIFLIIGIIIENFTKNDTLGNIFYIIIGLIISSFVYDFFSSRYEEDDEYERDEIDNLFS